MVFYSSLYHETCHSGRHGRFAHFDVGFYSVNTTRQNYIKASATFAAFDRQKTIKNSRREGKQTPA